MKLFISRFSFTFIYFLLLQSYAFAKSNVFISPFQNLREGKSFFIGDKETKMMNEASDIISSTKIDDLMASFKKNRRALFCETDFVEHVASQFNIDLSNRSDRKKIKIILFRLREKDFIDDVALGSILKHYNAKPRFTLPPSYEDFIEIDEKKLSIIFERFQLRLSKNACEVKAYHQLMTDLKKIKGVKGKEQLKSYDIKVLNYMAYQNDLINKKTLRKFEGFRKKKIYNIEVTLESYAKKLRSLRNQFPIDKKSSNLFATTKASKGLSQRMSLLKNYNLYQLALMADLVKKLRRRMDSDRIEIQIFDKKGKVDETVTLEPMERFRFVLKLFRKEMQKMKMSNFFIGQDPTFQEIILAAYETGTIVSEEIEQTVALEQIWNPKETVGEKIYFWVRQFGSISTVLIPQPYGFVSVIALIVIDSFMKKDPLKPWELDGNLF